TINTWNFDKQFGFVSCDNGRQDLFTHSEYILDSKVRYEVKQKGMRRGDRIAFEIEEPQGGKKSQQAINVEVLDMKRSRSPSRRRSRSRSRSRRRSSPPRRSTKPAEKERRPGDWDCPKCGDLQFARNAECRKCGALPRSVRDDSREKSRAPPPRRRSPSPRGRSPPPRDRSPPRGRSPPPRDRSPPPRDRSPPRGRSPPPRDRSPPRGRSPPPRGCSPSPPPRQSRQRDERDGSRRR
ncbi:unnamed protein product, partial [Polarella glacialis]